MKAKTFLFIILSFASILLYGQNMKPDNLQGSWLGRITTKDFSMRVIFKFNVKNNIIKGYIDCPDQGFKDLRMDKVWLTKDSIFVDASKSLNAGIIFKGLIVPGDSVIDGVWGGSLPLKMRPTNYVFSLKTNYKPEKEGYKINHLIKSTPLKDQQLTGACWSFATTSFIETESMRQGKEPVVLSPMFFVKPTYIDKAEKYIRMNGKIDFTEGDLTFSVLKAYNEFGAIPESVYSGKIDSTLKYDHNDMNDSLLEKVKFYVNTGRGHMTTEMVRKDMEKILSNALGIAPDTFIYKQNKYTPKSFAKEMIGINTADYVEITSYTHHPFYSKFILEIPSNWNNNYYLNLPLAEFNQVIDNALNHNYSVCWDGDIYEGYNNGFAVLGDNNKNITQNIRQTAFDNYMTQDVHNMHIIGIAENEKGDKFYIIKNSSDAKDCGGYVYMSKEYLLLKTISVMVNKNAIPSEILKKVEIKL
jgi:bleomycin hydrolase